MKYCFIICFFVINTISAQENIKRIDLFSEGVPLEFRSNGVAWIESIEKGDYTAIFKSLAKNHKLKKGKLKKNIKEVSDRYPYQKGRYGGGMYSTSVEENCLERIYFDNDFSKRAYYYQIQVFIVEESGVYKIQNIVFKEGEDIDARDEVLEELEAKRDAAKDTDFPPMPPMPPPPPPKKP